MKNVISNAKDYPTCVSDNMTKSEMDGLQVLFFFSFLFIAAIHTVLSLKQ